MNTHTKKPRRVWTCDGCGKVAEWGDGWMWSPTKKPPRLCDPEPGVVVCSAQCGEKVMPGLTLAKTRGEL